MIRVSIIDDHPMIVEGLVTMLEDSELIKVENKYHSATHLLKELEHTNTDVFLLDIQLEDGNGFDLCKTITQQRPEIAIIALTNFDEPAFVKNMIRNGAKGYLLKNTDHEELKTAIKAVYNGDQYLQKRVQLKLLNESIGQTLKSQFLPKLTRREKEILELILQEHTTAEIAEKLFISSKTVETHRSHLMQKLGVRNSAGLVKTAIEKGLI